MAEVLLPLYKNDNISYPETAYLLSIINQFPNAQKWYFSAYFNLELLFRYYAIGEFYPMFTFKNMRENWLLCPFINFKKIDPNMPADRDIVKYFIDHINNNEYILCLIITLLI